MNVTQVRKNATSLTGDVARDLGALARWELLITVVCSGAIVMLIEIIGTRIIGPVFGVSLFVWAALLSVTLCALAIGYYAGGVLIDRVPSAVRLGWALLFAGVALGLVLIVAPIILESTSGWGPRLGPLLAALSLFAPSLAALGMAGPMVVRLVGGSLATADVASEHKSRGTRAQPIRARRSHR